MTPRISLLLPARGRPKHLRLSIESAYDLAKKPDAIETIVRLDHCDPHLEVERAYIKDIATRRRIGLGVAPRVGYHGANIMYNWCAEKARGYWLYVWNDDTQMVTQDWDELLCDAPQYCVQFPRRDTVESTDYTFPVVARPIFEALGHLTVNAYADAWISDYSGFAGTSVIRDDIVFHHHRLNDATMREQSTGLTEWAKFDTDEQLKMRIADMDAVMASPLYEGRFDGWETEITYHVNVPYVMLARGEAKPRSYMLRGRK